MVILLSPWFRLGRWQVGRIDRESGQNDPEFKVNSTEPKYATTGVTVYISPVFATAGDMRFQGSRNMLTQVLLCYPNHRRNPGAGGAHAHLPATVAYILSNADVGRETGNMGLKLNRCETETNYSHTDGGRSLG